MSLNHGRVSFDLTARGALGRTLSFKSHWSNIHHRTIPPKQTPFLFHDLSPFLDGFEVSQTLLSLSFDFLCFFVDFVLFCLLLENFLVHLVKPSSKNIIFYFTITVNRSILRFYCELLL